MRLKILSCACLTIGPAFLLGGCAAGNTTADRGGGPQGFLYHDAMHPNQVSGNPSPQAIYNATHGTWLWPPKEGSRAG